MKFPSQTQILLKTPFPFQLLTLHKNKVREEYLDAQNKYKKLFTLQ